MPRMEHLWIESLHGRRSLERSLLQLDWLLPHILHALIVVTKVAHSRVLNV